MSERAASFEAGLAELEQLVDRLESGELELEDALAAFERGVALVAGCKAALEAAELRVTELRAGPDGAHEDAIALEEPE